MRSGALTSPQEPVVKNVAVVVVVKEAVTRVSAVGGCGYHDSVVDSRKSTWAACVVKLTRCMLPSADIVRLKSRSRVSIGSAPEVSSTIVISNVVSFSHTPDTSPMGADNLRSRIARGVCVCERESSAQVSAGVTQSVGDCCLLDHL